MSNYRRENFSKGALYLTFFQVVYSAQALTLLIKVLIFNEKLTKELNIFVIYALLCSIVITLIYTYFMSSSSCCNRLDE